MACGDDLFAASRRGAWLGRYFIPDQPPHIIQRGNDRQAVFYCDEDFAQ
jgi:REP element-mobilizing transposase RayT